MGVGQILLTNIDKDGTYQGLDRNVLDFLKPNYSIPFLIGGGFKSKDELEYLKIVFLQLSSHPLYTIINVLTVLQKQLVPN